MNLAIDIGNSLAKLAVIENGQVVDFLKTDRPDAAFVAGVLDANPAIDAAIADVKAGKTGNVPRELQNVHADTTGFDNRQHYLYPHDFPHRWVEQQYLPDALKDAHYYQWGDNKTEQAAKAYWERIKGKPL